MPSQIIRNHPIEIENATLLVGVGDLIYHPNYLPSSSNLDKVQMNQCVIGINGAQGRSSCLYQGTSANQLRNTINMLAQCEFITSASKVSTVLCTVGMSITAAHFSTVKPWVFGCSEYLR
jgi:hypothetical protein